MKSITKKLLEAKIARINQQETHVLVDEQGIPMLRGTHEEMIEQERACIALDLNEVTVEPISSFDWPMINMGD